MPSSNNPNPIQAECTPDTEKALLQRRGPKGYYSGSRKEFLESQIPAYAACKKGNRQKFWHALYRSWWQRYPWKLNDNEEPPTDDPGKMLSLASVAPGDQEQKKKTERQLTTRLTQWFANRVSAKDGPHEVIPWLPLLQQLHRSQYPRPRRRNVVQQFMLDYPEVVNAAFVSKHADGKGMPNVQKMNLRYDLAKAMLSRSYSHLTPDLEEKATIQHKADLEEWNMRLDGISAAEDISQARDSLFVAIHPLLQAIGSYADCYVSLIAGSAQKDETDKGFFTAVHWWPGDRDSTKDWTQWDEEAFNSGVAGPFLEYAGETDRTSQAAQTKTPAPVPSSALPGSVPIIDGASLGGDTPSVHTRETTITAPKANYRPLPTKTATLLPIQGTRKRKHTTNPRPIHYFEDTDNEDDNPGNLSGDGSSSGDSIPSDDAIRTKRQRTSRVVTRSSARTPAADTATRDGTDSPSLSPSVMAQPLPVIPNADVPGSTGDLLISLAATSIDSSNLQPANTSLDGSLGESVLRVGSKTPTGCDDVPCTEAKATGDAISLSALDTAVPPATDAEERAISATRISTDTAARLAVKVISARSSVVTPTTTSHSPSSPASSNDIDVGSVPAFLRSHGKGKRQVDIFDYLNKVKDPHFQQVLWQYIHIEIKDKSGASGFLPSTKRPVEISQWSARARPANLPDFVGGKRTLSGFIDSVFVWWGLIQPSWRLFKRGEVSREVQGDWGDLYAPRINGLLNVVILVYWWAKALKELKPEDGIRAEYEEFADDVAWVFSNLR